jgi:hypothetical protein
MKTRKNTSTDLKKVVNQLVTFLTKHRFILIFVILGAAVSFALLQTRQYIDIPRNETRFTEGKLTIKYKEINAETLQSFKNKLEDTSVEVDSQYDPERNNPFID